MNDAEAMLAIQELLDGTEWSAHTLECIAGVLVDAGYRVRDLDGHDRPFEGPAGAVDP